MLYLRVRPFESIETIVHAQDKKRSDIVDIVLFYLTIDDCLGAIDALLREEDVVDLGTSVIFRFKGTIFPF